jgi:DNA-binding transcriptional MerR regulator
MQKQEFRTSEIARMIGVHPNTVRMYEEIGFISKPARLPNGYRVYSQLHFQQMQFARTALRAEVLQNGLRKKAVEIIRLCAACQFDRAITCTEQYDAMLVTEMDNARAATFYVESLLHSDFLHSPILLRRTEAAEYLQVSTDTLRNWELNGLIRVKRRQNGYRVYDKADIERLRVIRTLRSANYSLTSILRLLNKLSVDRSVIVEEVLNTPEKNETILSVCDQLLESLRQTRLDVQQMLDLLKQMQEEN